MAEFDNNNKTIDQNIVNFGRDVTLEVGQCCEGLPKMCQITAKMLTIRLAFDDKLLILER